jgi:hypothetical protein
MRKFLTTAMAVALASATTYADLQNVEIGGGIRTRGAGQFFDSDADTNADQWVEQRTNIKFTADFTDEVSAVIEMDHWNLWGRDNRAGSTLGSAQADSEGINLYQAYIELGEAWGSAVDLKIGRQEIMLGSEFLVGNQNTAGEFFGLSFDGITGTYNADTYTVTAMAVKTVEADFGSGGNDRDTDLYGIYGSYTGREDMTIDAYWLFLRSGVAGDGNEVHTIGARVAGATGMVDYEVEAAFQTGEQDDTVDYEGIAVNAEVGYSFDTNLQPRVFVGFTHLSGDDEDQGFNRLFSDWEYTEHLANANLVNVDIIRVGGSIQATEKIALAAVVTLFDTDDEDDGTTNGVNFGTDDIGEELGLYAYYSYSEDVNMEFGWARLFLDEDVTGGDDQEQDYLYAEISLSF